MKDLLSNRGSNPGLLNKSRTTHPSDLISELTVTGSHDLYGMFFNSIFISKTGHIHATGGTTAEQSQEWHLEYHQVFNGNIPGYI